jgi:hypothetical protein
MTVFQGSMSHQRPPQVSESFAGFVTRWVPVLIYHKATMRIKGSRLVYDAPSGLFLLKDQPFTGVSYSRYPNGKRETETEWRDGLNWGRTRHWYVDGLLLGDAQMERGVCHGPFKEWHPNGAIAEEGECEYGIVIWQKKWGVDGNLVDDYRLKKSDRQYKSLQQRRRVYGSTKRRRRRTKPCT